MINQSISLPSFAKVNLFLHITGKKNDGYHTIQSVFARISLADTVHFSPIITGHKTHNRFVFLDCDITSDINDNLAVKSANALLDHIQKHAIGKPYPINIAIDKKIPTGAGLGGGSSNASVVIATLNRLWQCNLDKKTLINIAKTCGADVPFFVADTPYAICEGIGERVTPIDLPALSFLLVSPQVHNSTASFFQNPNLIKNTPTLDHRQIINRQADFLCQLNPPFFNAFEKIALDNADILQATHLLTQIGQPINSTARLTGTGSSVFLPFYTKDTPYVLSILNNLDNLNNLANKSVIATSI